MYWGTVFLMSLDISKEYDSYLLHRSESQTARCQEASCSFFRIRRWPEVLLYHSSIKYTFDWSTVKSIITPTPISSHYTQFYSIETRPRERITSTSSLFPLQAQVCCCCCCYCLRGGVFCFVLFNFKSWAWPWDVLSFLTTDLSASLVLARGIRLKVSCFAFRSPFPVFCCSPQGGETLYHSPPGTKKWPQALDPCP